MKISDGLFSGNLFWFFGNPALQLSVSAKRNVVMDKWIEYADVKVNGLHRPLRQTRPVRWKCLSALDRN